MGAWYYLLKGRPHGPVSADAIKQEIQAGRISAKDLLYHERDVQWRVAQEFLEFQASFTHPASAPPVSEQNWVLLVRKADGSGYRQRGPSTTSEVVQLLKSGDVSFTDYVWREGLKEWYKILAVQEIQQQFQTDLKVNIPVPKDIEDVDASTQVTKISVPTSTMTKSESAPPPLKKVESKKPEINLSDLSGHPPPLSDEKTQKIPLTLTLPDHALQVLQGKGPEKAPAQKNDDSNKKKDVKRVIRTPTKEKTKKAAANSSAITMRISVLRYFFDLSFVKKIGFIAGIIVFLCGLIVLQAGFSSYLDRHNWKISAVKKAFMESHKPTVPAAYLETPEDRSDNVGVTSGRENEVSNSKEVLPPPETVHSPSYLTLKVTGEGSDDVKIQLATDASRQFPIKVTVQAEGGDVLEVKNFYRTFKINKAEDRKFEPKLRMLPNGKYTMVAEIENITSLATFAFGTNNKDFRAKLRAHRKFLSFYHTEERIDFIKAATRLEREAYKLTQASENSVRPAAWSGFYKEWRRTLDRIRSAELDKINKRKRSDFVHGEMWLELKDLKAKMLTIAKNLNNQRQRGKESTSEEVKATALELTKLKDQMIKNSLWRGT